MVGETFGSYKVVGKIGEGGMGAVYLAEHSLIGRRAAIKVLLPEHSRNQDLIDRFFNEAKTAASLRHPALVEVFDFGIHPGSGSAYLVMDYLEGESLATRLTTVAPFSNELTMDLGRQLARGMEVAHRHGIVHRDLKPENIFLVPDADDPGHELVKIIDFGIAKLLPGGSIKSKSATSTGMLLGTPLYMAPEQCRGSGIIDHRADIYALGCILYAMLCGRPPFVFDGVGEILAAHMFQPAPALRTLNPEVSEALESLVMRTLAKDPAERPQTMAVLAIELGRLGGHQSQSMPATRPSRDGGTQVLPATSTTFSGAAPAPAPLPPPPRP
jgi:serine/threonine protein kinase